MIERLWSRRGVRSTALQPLAWLFGRVAARRRLRLQQDHPTSPLPLIVVGNLTVGGTGKTPLVAAIAALCTERRLRCGIVSRGYGATDNATPQSVEVGDDPARIGDEPVLLRQLTGVPVVVCADRTLAVAALAARGDIDLVLADDGMQHYAMARSAEICVIDAAFGAGNGRLLPAGPLREPVGRLHEVDVIAVRGTAADDAVLPPGVGAWPAHVARGSFTLEPLGLRSPGVLAGITTDALHPLEWLAGRRVHAVAGIGRPQRFFDTLRALGADVVEHAFPDHYRYQGQELQFDENLPVVTTEKDAVKLSRLDVAGSELLALSMRTRLTPELAAAVHAVVDRVLNQVHNPSEAEP